MAPVCDKYERSLHSTYTTLSLEDGNQRDLLRLLRRRKLLSGDFPNNLLSPHPHRSPCQVGSAKLVPSCACEIRKTQLEDIELEGYCGTPENAFDVTSPVPYLRRLTSFRFDVYTFIELAVLRTLSTLLRPQ